VKFAVADEAGVSRSQQDSFVPFEVMSVEIARTDGHEPGVKRYDDCRSDESVETDVVDRFSIIDEVPRGVHMSACVRSKRDRRHVGAGTAGDRLLQLDGDFGIAGINHSARSHRH
jgi:hypothetical protein